MHKGRIKMDSDENNDEKKETKKEIALLYVLLNCMDGESIQICYFMLFSV